MAEPLTVAEVADHLRLDGGEHYPEEALLNGMILAAREYCEQYLNRTIVDTAVTKVFDCFPSDVIELSGGDVISITSINYVDDDGANQTVGSHILSENRLSPDYGESWPSTRNQIGAVTIVYQAGYGGAVPGPVLMAMYLVISDLYENREGQIESNIKRNPTVDNLLHPYRIELGV